MHTYDDQVDYAIENYPRLDGIKTRVICGNHDLAIIKKAVPIQLDRLRTLDLILNIWGSILALGFELAPGFTAYLLHPQGGSAYALSYKPSSLG